MMMKKKFGLHLLLGIAVAEQESLFVDNGQAAGGDESGKVYRTAIKWIAYNYGSFVACHHCERASLVGLWMKVSNNASS